MNCFRKVSALAVSLALAIFASLALAAGHERPARLDAAVVMLEASVTAIDHKTRQVTLQGPEGDSVTITAGEEVENLDQVEVGDRIAVEYLEMVAMEVLPPGDVEMTATTAAAKMSAPPGEKPADAVIQETKVITEIAAIDKESELVTLKGPKGDTKTVKVRNPANLEKIVIGDKVLITHTTAVAVVVTEK